MFRFRVEVNVVYLVGVAVCVYAAHGLFRNFVRIVAC